MSARKVIPYGRQSIDRDDEEAVLNVLRSDFLTQGPKVAEFESAFADYVGAEYAVAVSNATTGLHLTALALGVKLGSRVITTPITFAASANCVRMCGGEVWFADIDPDTYLLSLEKTRELIESKPKGFFQGVVPVDFGGLPNDLEAFRRLADEHGLWITEDAAHAPGGAFRDSQGRRCHCGDGAYTDCSVFSFHPVKHIACGEGGMVTTNDLNLYRKISLLRTHGITKDGIETPHGGWYYEMHALGYNYRLTDLQSALGISQLAKNPAGVLRRREIAARYRQAFQGKIKSQTEPDGFENAYHLFVIEVENRKELYDRLRKDGILTQVHYIPVHTLPYYQEIGYQEADLANAERYYSRAISLPMYPTLTNKEQDFVIDRVLKYHV